MKIGTGPLLKGLMVALVALIVLAPVEMLRGLIEERARLRQEAVASVARGWGGEQLVGGPVLAIPVTLAPDGNRAPTADVEWYVLPESLTLESELKVLDERRKLGVYEVPVYVASVRAEATFNIESRIAELVQSQSGAVAHLDRARLVVPVSDSRGLRDIHLNGAGVADQSFEPDPDFAIKALSIALRPDAQIEKGSHQFDLTLQVAGTHSLSFLPTSRSTSVALSGNWTDPGFTRGFLPLDRSVSNGRFNARWQVLDLNRTFGSSWFGSAVVAPALQESAFGVDLVQPVDLYLQAERSVKYAGLFIALSLLTLFVWEHLARRPLHPIQYGLMALALSVFYLLLLALAEHVGFTIAYVCAAVALCGLLGVYLAGAFKSGWSGSGAGAVFAGVYALLYLLVTSEDYSLLVGSLAVFALLAIAMVLTRRLDWYETTARPQED
jgi:inner membrane protein